MPDHEHISRSLSENWARALGVSNERLMALVEQVLEERQALGKLSGQSPRPKATPSLVTWKVSTSSTS